MKPKFAIKDIVCVKIGYRIAAGEVVAIQGIDSEGQNLYRVNVPMSDDPSVESIGLYPEVELQAVPSLDKNESFSATSVMQYLEAGALIDILKRGSPGKKPSRARLRKKDDGLIFTFMEDSSYLIGATIPFDTVMQDRKTGKSKIFPAAKPRVYFYLRSFGLNHNQAQKILDSF